MKSLGIRKLEYLSVSSLDKWEEDYLERLWYPSTKFSFVNTGYDSSDAYNTNTQIFFIAKLYFCSLRDAGQCGPRRLCFTNYAYQSVSTSAGGALTRTNHSLSLWSLTNQSPVFRGEPFHENKPVSRGEVGPVHWASGLSIIGGVTQITIQCYNYALSREW